MAETFERVVTERPRGWFVQIDSNHYRGPFISRRAAEQWLKDNPVKTAEPSGAEA